MTSGRPQVPLLLHLKGIKIPQKNISIKSIPLRFIVGKLTCLANWSFLTKPVAAAIFPAPSTVLCATAVTPVTTAPPTFDTPSLVFSATVEKAKGKSPQVLVLQLSTSYESKLALHESPFRKVSPQDFMACWTFPQHHTLWQLLVETCWPEHNPTFPWVAESVTEHVTLHVEPLGIGEPINFGFLLVSHFSRFALHHFSKQVWDLC